MNKIQKVSAQIIHLPEARSFCAIGDPGCEGLGTYNMKVYAGALEKAAENDFTLIVGDLVPTGAERYYRTINGFTEQIAQRKVFVLRGNHDTGNYDEIYGLRNYAVFAEGFTLVVLDNALRTFEEEGLRLLKRVLAMPETKRVIVAFHIPVPNHFIRNCVSEAEFTRLKEAYAAHRQKVKYLLCGHVHSRFEDVVDNIPFICTGGGGAMIEDVSQNIRACDVEHHVVRFFIRGENLEYRFENISENCYPGERKNALLKERLEETVQRELMAHLKYLTFADRAERRGMKGLAALFSALARSEYLHARNFYAVLERPAAFGEAVKGYVPAEDFEYQKYYKMMAEYAKEEGAPLAEQAYSAARSAEKMHAELLREASSGDFNNTVYVCPICGYAASRQNLSERCPVCGGPERQFVSYGGNR